MKQSKMAVGAFPLIKLGALAIRQISKPLANKIKTSAKNSPFFRNYICMPPAQFYHYFDVNVRMRLLGLGKPSNVTKLNEAAAIELGAELLGEGIIFLVAVLTIAAEYYRQSKKSAADALAIEERWKKVEGNIKDLEYVIEKHGAEIRELKRIIYSNKTLVKRVKTNDIVGDNKPQQQQQQNENQDKSNPNADILQETIQEAVARISNQ